MGTSALAVCCLARDRGIHLLHNGEEMGRDGDLSGADDREQRELAIERIRARRGFRVHLVAYLLVNAALWALWVVIGGADGHPWPIWPTLGWGIGLASHWWSINRRPVSDDPVADEMKRMRRQ